MKTKSNILLIHNTYLTKGGEDAVVANELNVLRTAGYNVSFKEFNNTSIQNINLFSSPKLLNIIFNISSFFQIFLFIKKKESV